MNAIETLTQDQFVSYLLNFKGATFAQLTYFVDESKSRTKQGRKLVQKMVTTNVTIGANYEAKVNRILENKQGTEGTFEAQGMKGKIALSSALLQSEKDGEFMLYATIENHAKRETVYYFEGEIKTVSELKLLDVLAPAFFAPSDTKGRGAIDKENDFALISPKLKNIISIKMNKIEYRIV